MLTDASCSAKDYKDYEEVERNNSYHLKSTYYVPESISQ